MKKNLLLNIGFFLVLQSSSGYAHEGESCSAVNPFIVTHMETWLSGNGGNPDTRNYQDIYFQKTDMVVSFPAKIHGENFFIVSKYDENGGQPNYLDLCTSPVSSRSNNALTWSDGSDREYVQCDYNISGKSFRLEFSVVSDGPGSEEACLNRLEQEGYSISDLPASACSDLQNRCQLGLELSEISDDGSYVTLQQGTGYSIRK